MPKKKDNEKAYEVKDKRRVNPDGSLKDDAQPEAVAAEPEAEQAAQPAGSGEEPRPDAPGAAEQPAGEAVGEEAEQAAGVPGAEMPPPNVFETLQFLTGLLAEQAWQFMGLHLPPGRREPATDMVQAKIAIDVIISIADKLHPHLDEDSRKAIRNIISDLQLNFVQHNT